MQVLQEGRDVTQPGILIMMITVMLIMQTTCSGSGTIFFFPEKFLFGP